MFTMGQEIHPRRNPQRWRVSTPVSPWATFSPLAFSPVLWLDADDPSTITQSSNLVSQWNDKSGLKRHFTQGTSGNQPTLVENNQNGRSGISFNGDKFLTHDAGSDAIRLFPVTVFFVLQDTSVTQTSQTYRRFFSVRRSSTATGDFQSPNGEWGKNNTSRVLWQRTNGGGYHSFAYTLNQTFLFTARSTNAYRSVTGNDNSVSISQGTGDGTIANMRYMRVGASSTAAGNPPAIFSPESWNGYAYEIILYNRILSFNESSLVAKYLNSKWAIY